MNWLTIAGRNPLTRQIIVSSDCRYNADPMIWPPIDIIYSVVICPHDTYVCKQWVLW